MSNPDITPTAITASTAGPAANQQGAVIVSPPASTTKLQAFEGFLKKAGHIAGVVLSEIVSHIIPLATVVEFLNPAAAPAVEAFLQAVKLIQTTVVSIQQRWVTEGSEANDQKLADVLLIVEGPIVALFAQAGIAVDTPYVVNLINGVVALLNAQPGSLLPAKLQQPA